MQFQVPQFIETEAKIWGPFNIITFFYFGVSVVISYFLLFVFEFYVWIILAGILIGSAFAFALIKINGRHITIVALAAFQYIWLPKTYYKKQAPAIGLPGTKLKIARPAIISIPEAHGTATRISPLRDLLEKLNTSLTPIPKRELPFEPEFLKQQATRKERYEIIRKITGEKKIARRIDYR